MRKLRAVLDGIFEHPAWVTFVIPDVQTSEIPACLQCLFAACCLPRSQFTNDEERRSSVSASIDIADERHKLNWGGRGVRSPADALTQGLSLRSYYMELCDPYSTPIRRRGFTYNDGLYTQ